MVRGSTRRGRLKILHDVAHNGAVAGVQAIGKGHLCPPERDPCTKRHREAAPTSRYNLLPPHARSSETPARRLHTSDPVESYAAAIVSKAAVATGDGRALNSRFMAHCGRSCVRDGSEVMTDFGSAADLTARARLRSRRTSASRRRQLELPTLSSLTIFTILCVQAVVQCRELRRRNRTPEFDEFYAACSSSGPCGMRFAVYDAECV
jgi:hypothetical protein